MSIKRKIIRYFRVKNMLELLSAVTPIVNMCLVIFILILISFYVE